MKSIMDKASQEEDRKQGKVSHILVIDDEEVIRNLLTDILTEAGHKVIAVANAEEALAKVKEAPFEVVITDLMMPDMDGIQVLRKMKEKKPRLPIIMSTAYDYRDDFAVWASEAYVVKSSDTTELKETIKRLLKK